MQHGLVRHLTHTCCLDIHATAGTVNTANVCEYIACRRMKLKRNYHFMQYDDCAKGTPVTTPTHAQRGPPDRLLSGTSALGLLPYIT